MEKQSLNLGLLGKLNIKKLSIGKQTIVFPSLDDYVLLSMLSGSIQESWNFFFLSKEFPTSVPKYLYIEKVSCRYLGSYLNIIVTPKYVSSCVTQPYITLM